MKELYVCENKEAQKLYKIGMFAQINRITVKTLRYYDDMNLLKPEKVDEENGYRYYTSSQLPQLHKILALREMDFTIDEIIQVSKGASEEVMMQKKKSDCLKELAKITKKMAMIDSYLCGSYLQSDYRVILKSLPEVKVAYMHLNLSKYDDLFYQMPNMGTEMENAHCDCTEPSYCFTIYLDEGYKEENMEVEICEAVAELKEDSTSLKFKVLPAFETAACVLHKGAYCDLPKTYRAIVQFIEENGYEIIGQQREHYIDGVWNKDNEEEWLTEIQFPVRKIQ